MNSLQKQIDDLKGDIGLWWGHTPQHGWVVLDRTEPLNETGTTKCLTRCRDWQRFQVAGADFSSDAYRWFLNHLRSVGDEARQANALSELTELRREFLRRRSVIRLVGACISGYDYKAAWDARAVYGEIGDCDRRLARIWMKASGASEHSHAIEARMLSARCAEKVASQFYQSIGQTVVDVSAQQLQQNTRDWTQYDLWVGEGETVDVKNSRTPVNHRRRYVDHCVPQFKEARGQGVTIAGVLSPYVKLPDLLDVRNVYYPVPNIVFLGETDRSRISRLERTFSSQRIVIQTEAKQVIPPWAFELPCAFYSRRNASRERLRAHSYDGTPALAEFQAAGVNAIMAFLSAGVGLPTSWAGNLVAWEQEFYNRLLPKSEESVSMPTLFLTLLTHFLEMAVREPFAGCEPSAYRRFLFSGNESGNLLPLGIYDPLGLIDEFVSTLETLWAHRSTIRFDEYESFRFSGLGLLGGIRRGTKRGESILAYCGGYLPERGKCGFSPLIIGVHRTCPSCRKLICSKCGYCAAACSGLAASRI